MGTLNVSSPLLWGIVIGYLVVTIMIGNYIGRKAKKQDMATYFNDRSLPPMAVAFTCVATCMSGVAFMGTPGTMYATGYGYLVAGCALGGDLGIMLTILGLGKPMRALSEKFDSMTVTDLLCSMYKEEKLRWVVAPTIMLGGLFLTMVQWSSLGTLCSTLLGLSYETCIIIGFVVVGIYVVLGGNNSNAYVSIAQTFIMMFAAIYLMIFVIQLCGGWVDMNEKLAAMDMGYVKLVGGNYSIPLVISYCIIYGFGQLGQPAVTVKFTQIKDVKLFPTCLLFGVVSHVIIAYFGIIGVGGRVLTGMGMMAEVPQDQITPTILNTFAGPVVSGILVAAVLSAIMSTICSQMLLCSSTIVNDIMVKSLHMDMSGKKGKTTGQVATVLVMVVSMIMGMFPQGTLIAMGGACFACFACVILPLLVGGVRWRRSNRTGALIGAWCGFGLTVGIRALTISGLWTWPFPFDMGATTMVISIIVYVVTCLATKPDDKSHYMPPTLAELKASRAAKTN